MLLTEHLVRCETGGIDVFTPWYKSCIERLQQIFLQVSLAAVGRGAGWLQGPAPGGSSSRWQQQQQVCSGDWPGAGAGHGSATGCWSGGPR